MIKNVSHHNEEVVETRMFLGEIHEKFQSNFPDEPRQQFFRRFRNSFTCQMLFSCADEISSECGLFYIPLFQASIYLCSIPVVAMKRKLKLLLVVEIVVFVLLSLFLAWLGVQLG